MKSALLLACVVTLCVVGLAWTQEKQSAGDLQKQAQELEKKRQELLEKQLQVLKQRLDMLKRDSPNSKAVVAMQSILDLALSQQRVKIALAGAKIVADDGTYLGRIGPTYDTESIFCSYGKFGASYSAKSMWCTYGTYGATYNVLSPFCPYSSTPPKIMLDGTAVASLTVGWVGYPVSISPNALRAIFADE